MIADMIEWYKALIENTGLSQELYKWELVKQNLGCPNLEVADFKKEMNRLDMSNLSYQMVLAVIKDLLEKKPTEYQECLALIYDESKELNSRIKEFDKQLQNLYHSIPGKKKFSHHHDERTISVLLTYHNPTKYTFYKESYYMRYCKHLGVPHVKTKGEKYSH